MKLLSVVLSVFALAMFVVPGVAQDHSAHHPRKAQVVRADSAAGMRMMGSGMMKGNMMGGKGMMQGGMMSGMEKKPCGMMGGKSMMNGGMMGQKGMMGGNMGMHGPMHKFTHTVHHLPDLKSQLGLNDTQVEQLKNIRADFLKKKADLKASLEKKSIDLGLLLDKNASPTEVKKLLNAKANIQVTMQVTAYQTARKMQALLTTDQLQKFKSMNPMKMCKMMMGGKM